ncbi:MAG TPA: CpsB/CapC family capsule biosynthesis tyrosine phosphatase [Gaiellaceae bacterium]|nr:CpsB/CapC family capsule biosynthesis tyrosine phosphatase [Gaiellaceae bacterium]
MAGFVDLHSHVVPSGDDGATTVALGLELCSAAARHGTGVLYGTPHVWPSLPLTEEREREVRSTHRAMAATAARDGLDLRLGWELTPHERLLDEDPRRYRLGDLPAVLMEVPFHGPLAPAERLGEHLESAGLTPVVAHPERAESVLRDPGAPAALAERGWLLQVNATSLLGYHGAGEEELAWRLVEEGLAALVASDGHRTARPPFLDAAYERVRARVGEASAGPLFDGGPLARLAGGADRFDLAQRG